MIKLWFEQQSGRVFYCDEDIKCDSCNNIIRDAIIIKRYYFKQRIRTEKYLCLKCTNFKPLNVLFDATQSRQALIWDAEKISKKAKPIFRDVFQLKSSCSVADAVYEKESERTIDKTKFSGRIGSSWAGASIGSTEKAKELDAARKNDPLAILHAKPYIEKKEIDTKEVKRLEVKENDTKS